MARESKEVADTATLAEWEYNSIYDAGGIRAEYLITEEVFGRHGEEIGNVENAIISAKGRIVALILEVGGFWEISDTQIVIHWEQVKLIPDGFKVPVSVENYDDYLLFGEDSVVSASVKNPQQVDKIAAAASKTWKLTALLGDYAVLQGGIGYGYVDDVIFSKDGRIMALIVQSSIAAFGFGAYAFPYYGYKYGWQPYDNIYVLPYGPSAVKALEPFRYERFDGVF